MSRSLVVVLCLACFNVDQAARFRQAVIQSKRGPFSDPEDLVCGSKKIRTLLSQDHRNIPFTNIFEITDAFIQSQTEAIEKIQRDLSVLEGKVARARVHEQLQPMDPAGLKSAIIDSVSSTGSCGSVEALQQSECGNVRKPRIDYHCWEDAPTAFSQTITNLMSSRLFPEKSSVVTACKEIFASEGCDDFCHDIIAKASAATSELVGATHRSGQASDELIKKYDLLHEQLSYEQGLRDDCASTKETLESFEQTFRPLQAVISGRVGEEREAKNKMWDAEGLLEDMIGQVNEQDVRFKRAQELLGQADQAVAGADESFQRASDHTAAVTQKQSAATQELDAANDWLSKAMAANKAAEEIRFDVVRVMMDMLLFYDEAVRTPLRKLGIDNTVSFATKFPDVQALPSRGDLLKSLLEFKGFCTDHATTEALSVVEPKEYQVDENGDPMRPLPRPHLALQLCSKLNDNVDSDMTKVVENIENEVNKRTKALVDQFTTIQSWLLSTRFVQPDRLDKSKAADEIDHLREVMAVMSGTDIYKKYLTYWRFDQMFEKSVALLNDILERADQRLLKVTDEFNALTLLLSQAHADEAEAQEKLEQAISTQAIRAEDMQEAQRILNELTEQRDRFQSNLDELTEAWRRAKAALEGSKEKLQHTHKMALSFAELFKSLVSPDGAVAESA
jgi:hypothetical protein